MAGSAKPGIKTIWGIAKSPELKLTDEELHLLVQTHTGKYSIKELDDKEIMTVIQVLVYMKDSARRTDNGKSHSSGNPATENQRRKIYMLAKQMGWKKPARVNGMCRRMFGISAVEWLNYQQCSKLIEALKGMADRQEKQTGEAIDEQKEKID